MEPVLQRPSTNGQHCPAAGCAPLDPGVCIQDALKGEGFGRTRGAVEGPLPGRRAPAACRGREGAADPLRRGSLSSSPWMGSGAPRRRGATEELEVTSRRVDVLHAMLSQGVPYRAPASLPAAA
jgi:hypothetical protein